MAASPLEPHRRLISRLYSEGRSDDEIRESLGRRGLDATVFDIRSRLEAWHLVPAPSPVVSIGSGVVSPLAATGHHGAHSSTTMSSPALDPLVRYQQGPQPYHLATEQCMASARLEHFNTLVVDVQDWLRVVDNSPLRQTVDDVHGLPQVVREPPSDLQRTRAVVRLRRRRRRRHHHRPAARDPDPARRAVSHGRRPRRFASSRPVTAATRVDIPDGLERRSYMNEGENAGA